jgi:hypothetical protein
VLKAENIKAQITAGIKYCSTKNRGYCSIYVQPKGVAVLSTNDAAVLISNNKQRVFQI